MMALIPPFFLNAVVCIGVRSAGNTNWIGTGFLVGIPTGKGDKTYFIKLVTNKHVLINNNSIVVRFSTKSGNRVIDYPVDLLKAGNLIWVGHPNPSVDVAAFRINSDLLNSDEAEFAFFEADNHVLTVADMASSGVSEGDGVFILGFPLGMVGEEQKHVIARWGIVARIRDVLGNRQQSILVDANIFPGNSGGPVITKPEIVSIGGTQVINHASLIGIVKSFVPFIDVAVSQQTGRPRVTFEENSGLAHVEPYDFIRETVELCHARDLANP